MSVPRRTWLSVAAVSGVFAFIVLAVMLGLYARPMGENPFDSNEWTALKARLAETPTDRATGDRVRDLDLELRRSFFQRREQVRTGGVLLLAGLVVFLVAVKRANRRTRPEPDAPTTGLPEGERDRRAAAGGFAVAVMGALAGATAILYWMSVPSGIAVPVDDPDLAGSGVDRGPTTMEELAAQWPSFRGYDGSGVAGPAPLAWDGPAGKNVVWKTPIPLPGANSPVVWKDRVFLTGANARREEVYCIDADTGAMIWKKALVVVGRRPDPAEPMEDTGYAAPTAATDGRHVFAMFASGRVAAFDFEGTQVWLKSFGPFDNTYGHSSSLAVFEDRVLLQLDHGYTDDPKARLIALDAATGETVWETPRRVDSSWASPIVCYPPSGPQVVLSATPLAAAYDPATGTEIWRADVMHGEVAPTPIYRDGAVYVAQEDVGLFAIGTDGRGDVTETHVRWDVAADAPDVTSPLCDGERVYVLTTSGTLTCIHAVTGEVIWVEDLRAEYYASPMLAGNVLYLTSMAGLTTTGEVGDTFQETGRNPLGESVYASLAFAGGRIYIRGKDHLFAIGGGE